MGHPKRKQIFQPSIFRCYVSFREGKFQHVKWLSQELCWVAHIQSLMTCTIGTCWYLKTFHQMDPAEPNQMVTSFRLERLFQLEIWQWPMVAKHHLNKIHKKTTNPPKKRYETSGEEGRTMMLVMRIELHSCRCTSSMSWITRLIHLPATNR